MSAKERPSGKVGEGFLEGKLLIAMPGMSDPRFEKSVVFMCAHSSQGAMGIIINKPVEGLGFRDLMQKLEIRVTSNLPGGAVLYGGPMQTSRGFVLHTAEYEGGDSTLPISDDVSLTNTIDILKAIASGAGPEKSLLALGYASWGAGQLEQEIQYNGWIHCDADNSLLFDADYDAKWRIALSKLGIDMSGFSAQVGRA